MQIEKFKNQLIAFDFESDEVNITDMVNAYNKTEDTNKKVNDYLRLKTTKEFINHFESLNTGITVIKKQAGRYGGTYANRLIAYDVAAWLSPEFRLFIYSVFDSFIQHKLRMNQRELDYYRDKEDREDLYRKY